MSEPTNFLLKQLNECLANQLKKKHFFLVKLKIFFIDDQILPSNGKFIMLNKIYYGQKKVNSYLEEKFSSNFLLIYLFQTKLLHLNMDYSLFLFFGSSDFKSMELKYNK